MISEKLQPYLWLIVCIVGLPQFSETVYTPALPDIAHDLGASEALVEYTLTIYLAAFALGMLLWGRISDRKGRRPCLITGIALYLVGCAGCFFSHSITSLMISRFIQGFGGSAGSVLGQAICRDGFSGKALIKVFTVIGGALALSPALGPIIGGLIDQFFGWSSIFVFLFIFGAAILGLIYKYLPETHASHTFDHISMTSMAIKLLTDKYVMGFCLIIGFINGIQFSYFAEGPFYLINLLGLSPSQYGTSCICLAFAGSIGSFIARKVHDRIAPQRTIFLGLCAIVGGAILFCLTAMLFSWMHARSLYMLIATLLSMMLIMIGIRMTIPNCLSLALMHYKTHLGTASSLFGFFYYIVISFLTMIMGYLHNNTLFPMPFYFLALACSMIAIFYHFVPRHQITDTPQPSSK